MSHRLLILLTSPDLSRSPRPSQARAPTWRTKCCASASSTTTCGLPAISRYPPPWPLYLNSATTPMRRRASRSQRDLPPGGLAERRDGLCGGADARRAAGALFSLLLLPTPRALAPRRTTPHHRTECVTPSALAPATSRSARPARPASLPLPPPPPHLTLAQGGRMSAPLAMWEDPANKKFSKHTSGWTVPPPCVRTAPPRYHQKAWGAHPGAPPP